MPKLSVRSKLFGGYALVILVMAILTLFAHVQLAASAKHTRDLADSRFPAASLVGDLQATLREYRSYQYPRAVNGLKPATVKAMDVVLTRDEASIATLLRRYPAYAQNAADRAFAARFATQWKGYQAAMSGYQKPADRGDVIGALAILEGPKVQIYVDADATLTKWKTALVKGADVARAQSEADTTRAQRLMLILLGVGVVFAAALAWVISRGIQRSVRDVLATLRMLRDHCTRELRGGLQAVAAGDLTVAVRPCTPPIERISGDELGEVATAVNEIRANTVASVEAYNETRAELSQMIGEVQTTAATVTEASMGVADTSHETGRAVHEIAEAVGEMARGAEEQVRMIDAARVSAEETTRAAEEARTVAREGAGAAEHATGAMSAVRESAVQASEAIRALASKSGEIGGIVETITGISEQTNLLALNAAIEAARAGESGRGFAVVAEEVRRLAEDSQRAAAAIGGLIAQVQAETERAVEVVEAGAERSDEGAAVVEQARASFERIASAVDDITRRIAEIATATTEVASVAEQSSASTEEVSASTQQTSASTQEIAASAQQLAAGAQQLQEMVARFHLVS
jgi:methyl-accepting chemotaxis protein